MVEKPRKPRAFEKGGSHYKSPSGIPARGAGWGGEASGKQARAWTSEEQPPGEVKSAGHAVASEIKAQLAEKRAALVAKLLHLSEHAENEAVQLQATNAALDRLMGKPAQAIGGDPDGVPIKTVIAWETSEES